MIWAKCPKEIFVNKRRVKRAVTEAVCEYNKGTVRTIVETQKALGVATGGSTKQLATILDCRKQKFRKRRQNATSLPPPKVAAPGMGPASPPSAGPAGTGVRMQIMRYGTNLSTALWSVNAAAMASYQDLGEFQRPVIVGAREMGHSIFEVAMNFGFLRTTISQVYREFWESGNTSNLRYRCGQKMIIQERDQRHLTIIIKRDRRATLPQIAADFLKLDHQQVLKHHQYGLLKPKSPL
ncbi:HTH_Tnp_Tc3_2 domain-containing protein [Trichonephila clavipes]|nr:HTH_Tnp_Tc3_2 domain-containing protein [Trichonephila clavipes]